VAAVAAVFSAVITAHQASGESPADALAAGLSRSAILMAIMSAAGVALALLLRRHRPRPPTAVDRAAAAAVTTHTVPTVPAERG
jgi:hypothetical protein